MWCEFVCVGHRHCLSLFIPIPAMNTSSRTKRIRELWAVCATTDATQVTWMATSINTLHYHCYYHCRSYYDVRNNFGRSKRFSRDPFSFFRCWRFHFAKFGHYLVAFLSVQHPTAIFWCVFVATEKPTNLNFKALKMEMDEKLCATIDIRWGARAHKHNHIPNGTERSQHIKMEQKREWKCVEHTDKNMKGEKEEEKTSTSA